MEQSDYCGVKTGVAVLVTVLAVAAASATATATATAAVNVIFTSSFYARQDRLRTHARAPGGENLMTPSHLPHLTPHSLARRLIADDSPATHARPLPSVGNGPGLPGSRLSNSTV